MLRLLTRRAAFVPAAAQPSRAFAWSAKSPPADVDAQFPADWKAVVDKETKGRGPGSLVKESPEGICVKPIYTSVRSLCISLYLSVSLSLSFTHTRALLIYSLTHVCSVRFLSLFRLLLDQPKSSR